MPLYTFFLHDDAQSMPRFEIEWFDGPEAAAAHGARLLAQRSHYAAVTINEGEAEVVRLERQLAGA